MCLDNDYVTQVIFIAHRDAKDVSHCGQGAKVLLGLKAAKYGSLESYLLFVGCRILLGACAFIPQWTASWSFCNPVLNVPSWNRLFFCDHVCVGEGS